MKFYFLRLAAILLLLAGVAVAEDSAQTAPTIDLGSTATQQNSQPTPATPAQAGQQPSLTWPAGAPAGSSPDESVTAEPATGEREGHQRIGFVVPAFGVTDNPNATALSPRQKFSLFARSAFDPFVFVATGLQTGASQMENEFPEYGQGAVGYVKRYASAFTDAVDANFMGNFLWPVILKEDPRYFRMGKGSYQRRLLYSLEQEVWCKTDSGARTVCGANVLGAFSAGAVSNLYYPREARGLALTASRSSISMGFGSMGNLAVEFWPDMDRWLHRKRSKQPESTQEW
ncbi:MAG: hypothetical protein ABSD20_06470 [Terriglobales bacterium]|jgi:hypothetical protein